MSGTQEESTMYFLLHKVLHLETLEDRIFDLENKNIELEVNYKILKSELDKITHQSQNLVDDDNDNVTDHYDGNENSPSILTQNCGSSSKVNHIEIVCSATLRNESESREESKVVEEESSMSIGQLDIKVNSDSEDMDFNSNPASAGLIDIFDEFLMENVKSEPTTTTNDNTVEIEIEDQKPVFDILPYEKLKLNLFPVVLLKRIDPPPLCLRTQKESKKKIQLKLKLSKAKAHKKSAKCQVGFEKKQLKKATFTCKKSESYKCIICLKNISRNKLATHYQSHKIRIDVKSQNFECKICPKLFQIRVDFVRHMREHLGMKLYECPICLRKFASSLTLTTHMRVHTGEKPYSCSVCKRQFSQVASLNRHKRIHSGEKPYGCTLCPKFFRVKDHLTIHTRYHNGERPYECSVCFKKFVCKSSLNLHNKVGHKKLKKCKKLVAVKTKN